MPPRVGKPSLEIAAIAGRKEASRSELKKLLWTYIKNNNLQCENPNRAAAGFSNPGGLAVMWWA